MKEPTLSSLIIGPSGHGKSWLASTAPAPRLILDLEGRARYTPNGKGAAWWDGRTDPNDGASYSRKSTTGTVIVDLTESTAAVDTILQWVRSGRHPFRSVVVDSLMEAQYQAGVGKSRKGYDYWDDLLLKMESLVRGLTDMLKTAGPRQPLRVVTFIAGVIEKNGYQKPLMQGQITTKVPYWMDLVGFLEKVRLENGKTQRRLWLDQRPENDLEVKDGTNDIISALGPCILLGEQGGEPNLATLYDALVTAQKEEA
jgi:hypothetical protein